MVNYQGKNIVIIGLGITGLSCVDYFLSQNVIPKVIDTRERSAINSLDKLDSRVPLHLGSFNDDWILSSDLVVVSPGIALSTPVLVKAQDKGIEIVGDIELFCREINLKQNKKIVAITGSNGKTTVTTLVGEVLANAGIKVGVGGNIGEAALTLLNHDYDAYVLELSSFQLETTHSLQATVATILNISEDHMDRYPQGIMQYVAAKQRIYKNAAYALVNHDDELTHVIDNHTKASVIEFGLENGDYHLDKTQTHLVANGQSILDVNQMQLIGLHNYLNVLAVLAISDKLGVSQSSSLATIKNFKGLSHRFELVHQHNDVKWINDSKATNVGSTVAALNSLICSGTLYLLLGGDGKAADFSPLLPYLLNRNIVIYCFGQDKDQLAKLRPEVTVIVETMDEAIKQIASQVKPKDVVLLSPACASLDQFKNYAQRGSIFAQLAKACHS